MKKRACRHCRDLCNLSFETWYRYNTHASTRGHLWKEVTSTVGNVQLEENEIVPESDCVLEVDNDQLLTTLEQDNFGREPELFSDTELSSEGSDEEELSGCEDTQDILLDQISNNDSNFFPFPSEIFFLLYCYAHNTSRPKVKHVL